MRHMRDSAIILAALLAAMSMLAAAEACGEEQPAVKTEVPQPKKQWLPLKQCLKVNVEPGMAYPTYVKYADTVHCFLRPLARMQPSLPREQRAMDAAENGLPLSNPAGALRTRGDEPQSSSA